MGSVDYESILRKTVDLLGIGKEHNTSAKEIAEAISENTWQVQRIKQVAEYVGGIKVASGTPRPGHIGKGSYWTVLLPADEILAKIKEWDADFTEKSMERIRMTYFAPGPINGPRTSRGAYSPPKPIPPAVVALGTSEDGTQMAIAGPDPVNPFAKLRVLRFDEARAMVELAKQYKGRLLFIQEEYVRFREHGIVLKEESFDLPADERLEAIGLVLSYIESLEHKNDILTERATPNDKLRSEVQELRRTTESQSRQIERLVSEKHGTGITISRADNGNALETG